MHNPFFTLSYLTKELEYKNDGNLDNSSYYNDAEIETVDKLPRGSVHKLTSSFIISYEAFGQDAKKTVDLGLNVKDFYKKCHVLDLSLIHI